MKRLIAVVLAVTCLGAYVGSQALLGNEPQRQAPASFDVVDVFVDSKDAPLAAYQLELSGTTDNVSFVDVQSGEYPSFAGSPFFDAGGLPNTRIIIADFNTGRNLPRGRTRVAQVHIQITGDQEPRFAVELVVAAGGEAQRIPAIVSFAPGTRPWTDER